MTLAQRLNRTIPYHTIHTIPCTNYAVMRIIQNPATRTVDDDEYLADTDDSVPKSSGVKHTQHSPRTVDTSRGNVLPDEDDLRSGVQAQLRHLLVHPAVEGGQ